MYKVANDNVPSPRQNAGENEKTKGLWGEFHENVSEIVTPKCLRKNNNSKKEIIFGLKKLKSIKTH